MGKAIPILLTVLGFGLGFVVFRDATGQRWLPHRVGFVIGGRTRHGQESLPSSRCSSDSGFSFVPG